MLKSSHLLGNPFTILLLLLLLGLLFSSLDNTQADVNTRTGPPANRGRRVRNSDMATVARQDRDEYCLQLSNQRAVCHVACLQAAVSHLYNQSDLRQLTVYARRKNCGSQATMTPDLMTSRWPDLEVFQFFGHVCPFTRLPADNQLTDVNRTTEGTSRRGHALTRLVLNSYVIPEGKYHGLLAGSIHLDRLERPTPTVRQQLSWLRSLSVRGLCCSRLWPRVSLPQLTYLALDCPQPGRLRLRGDWGKQGSAKSGKRIPQIPAREEEAGYDSEENEEEEEEGDEEEDELKVNKGKFDIRLAAMIQHYWKLWITPRLERVDALDMDGSISLVNLPRLQTLYATTYQFKLMNQLDRESRRQRRLVNLPSLHELKLEETDLALGLDISETPQLTASGCGVNATRINYLHYAAPMHLEVCPDVWSCQDCGQMDTMEEDLTYPPSHQSTDSSYAVVGQADQTETDTDKVVKEEEEEEEKGVFEAYPLMHPRQQIVELELLLDSLPRRLSDLLPPGDHPLNTTDLILLNGNNIRLDAVGLARLPYLRRLVAMQQAGEMEWLMTGLDVGKPEIGEVGPGTNGSVEGQYRPFQQPRKARLTAAELHGLPRPDRLRVLHLGLHICNCSSTRKELAWLVDHARLDRLSGYLYCDLLSLPRVLPVEAGERLLGNLEARVGDAVLERTSETAELVDIRAIKTNLKRIRPPTRWHMRVSFPLFFFYRLLETACDAATELASPITFQHKADMSDNTTKSAEKSEDKPLREQIKAHHEKPTGQETNDETSQLTGPKKAGKEKSSMEENIAQFVNAEMGRPEKLSSRRELHQSQSVAHLASHGCSLLTSIVQTDRMYLTFSCITFCILIALFSTIC